MRARAALLSWIGVCGLLPCPLALAAPPAGEAEQQLRKLEREWTEAEFNRDADALGRILDEHFVATYGAGKPRGKAEYIRDMVNGADTDRLVSEDLSDQSFVVAGDSAAVAELDTVHMMRNGKPYTEVARITTAYAKRGGRWVALAEHLVLAPGPAGAAHFDAGRATAAYMATLSPQARARSDRYFEGGYWLLLWDFVLGLGVAALLLYTPLSRRMRDFGERVTRHKWLQVVLYAVLYVALTTALTLPWLAYEGYFREHQYGMSNQTPLSWLADQGKELMLSLILVPPALAVLYAVVRRSPRNWWLWGAVVSMLLLTFQQLISPTYLEPVFNKFYPLAESPLKQQLLSMARANQIPVRQIYEFDASKQTTKMSAQVSGLLGTAQVSLNDNLINRGSPEEVQAVLGHEMGHYVLNHQYKGLLEFGIIVVLGFAFLSWSFNRMSRRYTQAWGIRGITDVAGLPLLVALFSAYLFVLTPVLNTVIRNMEAEADAFALNASRQPDGFAKAALDVSQYRKMQPGPVEEALLYDHPSGWNRIHRAMVWKAENIDAADIVSYDASHHPPGAP
jgi:Zn-dependent protease with chaperone function